MVIEKIMRKVRNDVKMMSGREEIAAGIHCPKSNPKFRDIT